jgi:histone-lysine N-methyltransferase SETMAR
MDSTRKDIRKLILYCWKRKLSTEDAAKEINSAFEGETTTQRTCRRWYQKFNAEEFDCNDSARGGRPSFDLDDSIEQMILDNKHASSRLLAEELDVHHSTICDHLNRMGKRYLSNVWIPHLLSEENKNCRVQIAQELLTKFRQCHFLQQLITADELWIYWEPSTNNGPRKSWRASGDSPAVDVRRTLTNKKNLAIIFWDSKGILLFRVLPRGVTMTAKLYCELLDELKIQIQLLRRRELQNPSHNMHFLHDNAPPHRAAITAAKLDEINLPTLRHPPYSPDLSPSDYFLFSSLKSSFKGQKFQNTIEIETAFRVWQTSKTEDFFQKGINMLPARWEKCVEHNGNYFEHEK